MKTEDNQNSLRSIELKTSSEMTLEHILPKTPGADWDEKWSNKELHNSFLYRLGNLTLLHRDS